MLSIPFGSAWSTRQPGEAVGLRFVKNQITATMPLDTASPYGGTLVDVPVYPHASTIK